MPALNMNKFDMNALIYAPELKVNKAGGKYATVGYGDLKNQVEFQLGQSPKDALRCPFGVEPVSENEPTKLQIKLNLTAEGKAFIEQLENTTLQAAATNSVSWFKKKMDADFLKRDQNSAIKPSVKPEHPDMLKIRVFQDGKAPTEVQVTTWTNDGKLTPFTKGSLEDVKGGMVLPIIKIQGGVYFVQKNFGTSLAASRLLVIRDTTGQQSSSEFELGDVEMADANSEEDDM